ncbi:MAG: hypothetical protein ABIN91_01290 [Mucilaginibacter sp.]
MGVIGPETLPYKELKSKNMLPDFHTWPELGVEMAAKPRLSFRVKAL